MAIYITGDTHGNVQSRLWDGAFPVSLLNLNEENVVVVTGDFGVIGEPNEHITLAWLEKRPYIVCFIDGNHDNYDRLKHYKAVKFKGGMAHQINNNVYHLLRGEVYHIANKSIFTFGGAKSVDRDRRVLNVSYWAEEMPSDEEYKNGFANLKKYDNKVDYILTHTCSSTILDQLPKSWFWDSKMYIDEVNLYFDGILSQVSFKYWLFGHFHRNMKVNDSHRAIYNDIIKLTE